MNSISKTLWLVGMLLVAVSVKAETIGCVTTAWKLIGANHKVYVAISRRLIDGAPANSISTVPVMPWGGAP